MPGKFVVFEGIDGVGKTTQVELLSKRLRDSGYQTVETHEPGATQIGQQLRQVLLHGKDDIDDRSEALLMAADRAQHLAEVVRPALEAGAVVISDRFVPSSLVYQGVGRGLGVEWVESVNQLATDGLEPDLVVVFDLELETSAARLESPSDRFESAGDDFRQRIRDGYLELAPVYGWNVVDASESVEQVHDNVWSLVEPLLDPQT